MLYSKPELLKEVQWNPSKTDTTGTQIFVRYTGVSFTEGLCKPHPLELLGVVTRFQCQTAAYGS